MWRIVAAAPFNVCIEPPSLPATHPTHRAPEVHWEVAVPVRGIQHWQVVRGAVATPGPVLWRVQDQAGLRGGSSATCSLGLPPLGRGRAGTGIAAGCPGHRRQALPPYLVCANVFQVLAALQNWRRRQLNGLVASAALAPAATAAAATRAANATSS